jgi:hypothetical protein
MLLNVYLCGWLVTTIGALVAANRLPDRRMTTRPRSVGLLAVLAGVLWPVLTLFILRPAKAASTAGKPFSDSQAPQRRPIPPRWRAVLSAPI